MVHQGDTQGVQALEEEMTMDNSRKHRDIKGAVIDLLDLYLEAYLRARFRRLELARIVAARRRRAG